MSYVVNVSYNVRGRTLPINNGYPLYAAISKVQGCHVSEGVGIQSIGSKDIADGIVYLSDDTMLRVRTTSDKVKELLRLAGKRLEVDGHVIYIGVPQIEAVQPASTLYSRLVTYRNALDEGTFLTTTMQKMEELDVHAKIVMPMFTHGPLKSQVQRRIVNIKGKKIVGYGLLLQDLSPDDSFKVLSNGLGGRRHMGCGIFSPVRED